MSTDGRVAELLAQGDVAGASTEAIRGLGPRVLRYFRSVLRDEDEAADAFSQFAENVWKGLADYRGDSALLTWAFRIARNVAANTRRSPWLRGRQRLSTGAASALAESMRTRTLGRSVREGDALRKLREALSIDDQSLLALRIDQELSWAEVADILSKDGRPVQPAALMKRFERLKQRLGTMARKQGLLA
ncbi:MAG TPA: sigma-70 family RNA polymerase sigma factor [Anaeromyxobacteraceae bacterium]|nr:sigma-70 family RNA polymerase sigma factor [Anaeromyxobacteraceae bacterium]